MCVVSGEDEGESDAEGEGESGDRVKDECESMKLSVGCETLVLSDESER